MYIGVVTAEKAMRIVASRQPPQGYSFQAIPSCFVNGRADADAEEMAK